PTGHEKEPESEGDAGAATSKAPTGDAQEEPGERLPGFHRRQREDAPSRSGCGERESGEACQSQRSPARHSAAPQPEGNSEREPRRDSDQGAWPATARQPPGEDHAEEKRASGDEKQENEGLEVGRRLEISSLCESAGQRRRNPEAPRRLPRHRKKGESAERASDCSADNPPLRRHPSCLRGGGSLRCPGRHTLS